MLFKLIKNELIKLFKRTKTWIVFGLFIILILATCVISSKNAKDIAYNYSPEGRIEMLEQQKSWAEENIKSAKKRNDQWTEEDIKYSQEEIERLDREIEIQKERQNSKDDSESWKAELEDEKKNLEEAIADETVPERYKEYEKKRLEMINIYFENNIEPIETWEFNAVNYGLSLMEGLGMIFLIAGIAIFMSDIISGESTPPTLKFLLVQPISRGKVILSKFIAVVLTVITMICGSELITYGILGLIKGFDAAKMPAILGTKYQWDYSNIEQYGSPQLTAIDGSGIVSTRGAEFIQSFALQVLFIIACCAFVFLISAIFKSSMISMAVSVILSVTATMLNGLVPSLSAKIGHLIFLNYGMTPNLVTGDIATMFNNPNMTITLGVILMIATTIISYVLAHFIFKKKDILI